MEIYVVKKFKSELQKARIILAFLDTNLDTEKVSFFNGNSEILKPFKGV